MKTNSEPSNLEDAFPSKIKGNTKTRKMMKCKEWLLKAMILKTLSIAITLFLSQIVRGLRKCLSTITLT